MLESKYQASVIKKLRIMFPGCIILKNDANYLQGICDLTILWGRHWAWLEVKVEQNYESDFQPNQRYYVNLGNMMSFARVITPFNEPEVLRDLQNAFDDSRCTCTAEPKQLPLGKLR